MAEKSDSVGIVEARDFVFGLTEDDYLPLDCGRKLGSVNIRYETYGELNGNASNAVLLLHALSGDAHAAGYYSADDKKPGWWDEMVGPGKAFDTNRYFIVCSNVIGGCSGSTGPGSINPATGKTYGMDFPVITIADMVRAQYRLMRNLKIDQWLAVAGGSMGGMQALQWAVSYPDAVKGVIAIATSSKISPQSIAFNWVGREAIKNDPNWNNGDYGANIPRQGLSTARMLAHITYLSDESMLNKFGRNLQKSDKYSFDFDYDFAVESYLQYQGARFVDRFDANSYLYITRAIDYFDLSDEHGSLSGTFRDMKSDFMVISFSSDWLFPPYQSEHIVKALVENGINVTSCTLESSYGHDAFLLEVDALSRMTGDFLRNLQAGGNGQ
jgi:homoserine O-acetyltransferase